MSEWWRQASFYQIYPRSFYDSNADGEGDLLGIVRKIPYLKALSIDAVWLSPFYPSPLKDGGYDVADPRNVDPRFGTLEDVDILIEKLHEAGIKLIVDIVPNHVSVEHPWFQPILQGKSTVEQDLRFHILESGNDAPPNNWISVFGGSAWSQLPDGRWYLHLFDESQPDLNWTNPEVVADGLETLKFWLDRGVDGFRVDVAFGLMKDMTYASHPNPQGLINAMRLDLFDAERDVALPNPREVLLDGPFFDRDEVHDIYRNWRKLLNQYSPTRMAVAEAWAYPASRAMAYARSDELHQVFNFDFMVVKYDATSIRRSINEVLTTVALVDAPATWVLSNHDSKRVVTRLGSDGAQKACVLATIAHALPGGIYIYQGEELGLPDADVPSNQRQDPIFFRTHGQEIGRDGARVPLPWLAKAKNFGFSDADSLWLPQPQNFVEFSADTQERTSETFLSFYRDLLGNRRTITAKANERAFEWITHSSLDENCVVAFTRGDVLLAAANTSSQSTSFQLPSEWTGGQVLLRVGHTQLAGQDVHLGPHSALWISPSFK